MDCTRPIAVALYGIENKFGHLVTPLRASFNWAEEQFLGQPPDVHFEVVMNRNAVSRLIHSGVDTGKFAPGSLNNLMTGIAQAIQSFVINGECNRFMPLGTGDLDEKNGVIIIPRPRRNLRRISPMYLEHIFCKFVE